MTHKVSADEQAVLTQLQVIAFDRHKNLDIIIEGLQASARGGTVIEYEVWAMTNPQECHPLLKEAAQLTHVTFVAEWTGAVIALLCSEDFDTSLVEVWDLASRWYRAAYRLKWKLESQTEGNDNE